ncbi:hypothetical protein H0H81_000544 [Sphagnurus paluster]|uniref:F-box domain-containing protein n=1 Tax=Sphagnurus paluster TaxID=117069 RepID=A0A9P7FU19_9AGAR|nr:hypothetical protein H0H81_000544 [Sphagnurus paluster]
MGQYFIILNLDSGYKIPTGMFGKFGECFWGLQDTDLARFLWCPPGKRVAVKRYSELQDYTADESEDIRRYLPSSKNVCYHYHFPKKNAANEAANGFRHFPNELIDLVYQELDDLTAILGLAATCQRSYDIGRRYIEHWVRVLFVPTWVGGRLICLGDYACADDLPPGMLTDEELRRVDERITDTEDSDNEEYDYDDDIDDKLDWEVAGTSLWRLLSMLQRQQPDWELQRKRQIEDGKYCYDSWRLYVRFLHSSGWGKRECSFCMEETVLSQLITIRDTPRTLDFVEADHSGDGDEVKGGRCKYVLRNLVTKEYVRDDAVEDFRNNAQPNDTYPDLRQLNFNHILVARIT